MNKIASLFCVVIIFLLSACSATEKRKDNVLQNLAPIEELKNRWEISGKGEIVWNVAEGKHTDHIEMSGLQVSGIISYGVDEKGEIVLSRKVVWPMLRTIPNNTHASLIHTFPKDISPVVFIDDAKISSERPCKIWFNGLLSISSKTPNNIEIKREIFPSTTEAVILELFTIKNQSAKQAGVDVRPLEYSTNTPEVNGVYGSYNIMAKCSGIKKSLRQGEAVTVTVTYSATKKGQELIVNGIQEKEKRKVFVASVSNSLDLETPDKNINEMFRFSKIRGTESIYATKGGLMHGPGGGSYYAAIWANDQAEYINPFFPFLGNENGNESAINSFRHFARFINPDFNPIPSSIIAEGVDIWNGAGDRGDAAMIAYGASRFALAYGDVETAKELLPLIKWCLQYCEKQMLPDGVIASDSDELEGRFPAGTANLSTNMLAYGAYKSAANLLRSLNEGIGLADKYDDAAEQLRMNCDAYFGGNVMGYDTYKYFKENVKLRSWICLPLTMGIFDRKEETLKALFSPKLWNQNGIYTEAGNETFWDRSTLYAFRGILYAGETNLAMRYFKYYSQKRLLGEHVPYPVEAWPEGQQRHLSAESALYCRVITEGLFGIIPTGFNKFLVTPWLPDNWNFMKLKNVKAFKHTFDIEVSRNGNHEVITVKTSTGDIITEDWNGKEPLEVVLP